MSNDFNQNTIDSNIFNNAAFINNNSCGIIYDSQGDEVSECKSDDVNEPRQQQILSLIHPDLIPTIDSKSNLDDTKSSFCAKTYYQRNKERLQSYGKLRYKQNREKLLAISKEYQSSRKDILRDRNTIYYERNRDKLLQDRATKISCECGKMITKGSYSSHLKTKYHMNHIELSNKINEATDIIATSMTESLLN
jgi:hypothetical protein